MVCNANKYKEFLKIMANLKNVTLSLKKGKSKTGNDYICLGVDLGYTFKAFTFNRQDIAEIFGFSVVDFVKKVEPFIKDKPVIISDIMY